MPGLAWRLTAAWTATVAIETIVLMAFLSERHNRLTRLFAGTWLSSCTLPVVWLVLPECLPHATPLAAYLLAAETFAPLAECGLFWWVCVRPLPPDVRSTHRDYVAIVLANLASFTIGEVVWWSLGLA
jgi:hypothetical protein